MQQVGVRYKRCDKGQIDIVGVRTGQMGGDNKNEY